MAATSIKETGLAGAVKLVVKTFLEQKHYQQLHDLLSEEWSHCHSLTAAVRLMEAHGVHIQPEEESRLAALPEDRMIDSLVYRMPQQSREQFEHFFLQLSLIASTTTRLRSALETGNDAAVEEVMDSAENVGILQFILKMAVAQAGQEVKAHNKDHEDWLAATTDRLTPLLQSQATFASSAKALAEARSQLEDHHSSASEKAKKVMLALAGNSGKALLAMSFHEWREVIVIQKKEAEIRVEYAEEIDAANKRLQDYIDSQTTIMRSMINRRHAGAEQDLISECFGAFVSEWQHKNDQLAKEQELKDLEARMASFSKDQAAKSKKVLGRMNAGTDEGLMHLCFTAWIQFLEEYKKNKDFEDAVKDEEKKLKAFMNKQKDGASTVLSRLNASTDIGLIGMIFMAWKESFLEYKKQLEMEEMLNQNGGKFGSFGSRNKGAAMSANQRAAYAQDVGSMVVIFWYWKIFWQVERMRRFAKEKNNKKKQQLVGVKGLFKNFANELEAGLKEGTPRQGGAVTSGPPA